MDVKSVGIGALFHDIGKNAIDESILNKPSRLDKDEFEVIKRHSCIGYEQLKDVELMTQDQLSVVLQHHEAMDGSGYPLGLKGQEIHRYARVARIVDCYDALTTKRCYRDALSPASALALMAGEMRHSFDPELFQAFVKFLKVEGRVQDGSRGNRFEIELGSQVMIQFSDESRRTKATLVGMESGEYLIFRIPGLSSLQKRLQPGREAVGRYAHSGAVYGFRASILGYTLHPVRLLFLSYPKVVENINLRRHPRIDCFLPGEARIRDKICLGAVTDLSAGGCKFLLKQDDIAEFTTPLSDERATFRIQFPGEAEPDEYGGRVRSVSVSAAEGKASLGIQFMDLSGKPLEHLKKCIHDALNLVG